MSMKVMMQSSGNKTLAGFTRRISLWLGVAVLLGGVGAVLLVLQLTVFARIVADLAFGQHALVAENTSLKVVGVFSGCACVVAMGGRYGHRTRKLAPYLQFAE